MKKKGPSKLILHRETLWTLESGKLTWALGGAESGETCGGTCGCSGTCSCNCSYGTCAGGTADAVCTGAGCVAQ
jgi:hypothetical protein